MPAYGKRMAIPGTAVLALVLFCAGALTSPAIAGADGDPTVPDNRLTPGALTSSDPAVVCHAGYSREHRLYGSDRSAYDAMRKAVFAAYGVPWSERGERELDHRVPLALGGADAIANLWPEPLPPTPWNAVLKDQLEYRAVVAACYRHMITLSEAQAIFLGDWRIGYCRLIGGAICAGPDDGR
jgi:hypothetical protein